MRGTQLKCALGILISTCVISTSALAEYIDPHKARAGQTTHMKTFSNYADYARYVRNAPDRYYNFPSTRPATGKNVFIYDPRQLSWAAYDASGNLVRTGPGSAGNGYCPDIGKACHTPTGTFKVFAKHGPEYKSKTFPIPRGGAPMPYAMFFSGGSAIHGSSQVVQHNASHGCIRTLVEDAQWLNNSFLSYGSTVIIRPY